MIGRVRGTLLDIEGMVAVVDAGGVGYEVLLPDSVMLSLPPLGEPVELLTRQVFREDGVALYGFLAPFQRRLFDLLTSVKGCGPKIALALIGQVGEDAIAGAILAQDTRALARATGVGPKLAERIVLELKEKVAEENFHRKIEAASRRTAVVEDPVVDALLALGYRRQEAELAAEETEGDGVEERLRSALRRLQK